MNCDAADKIANAVLYEGYMLYPYRASAVKNQQRWNFGTLYPPQYEEVRRGTERSVMHVECLLRRGESKTLKIRARFLQFDDRPGTGSRKEGVERTAEFEVDWSDGARDFEFCFPSAGGEVKGSVSVKAENLSGELTKFRIELVNESATRPEAERDEALTRSMISAHMILYVESGDFVSLLDPPSGLAEAVAGCRNEGCFPVLVGEEGRRNMLLCSPIILYDFPQVAPESAGDFFDGTEMDEMLTLRLMTLAEEEKNEIRGGDDRARDLLQRTEQTAREQLMRTHGTIRSMRPINE